MLLRSLLLVHTAAALVLHHGSVQATHHALRNTCRPQMGLLDSFKAAFANEEFTEDDQRVRASHILIKGDDCVAGTVSIMRELSARVQSEGLDRLQPIFAELA